MSVLANALRLLLVNGLIKLVWNRVSKITKLLIKKLIHECIRRLQSSERYSGDIEGMISDYAELLSQARSKGVSPFILGLRVTQYAFELGRAVLEIKANHICFTVKLFAESLALIHDYNGNNFSHDQIDVFSRLRSHGAVIIRLDATGRIVSWGSEAEKLFKFKQQDVLQKIATESIIPKQQCCGVPLLQWLLEGFCKTPKLFLLNMNPNITATGEHVWMFWINLPVHQHGQTTRIMCIGIKLENPLPMRFLIWFWRLLQHEFVQPC